MMSRGCCLVPMAPFRECSMRFGLEWRCVIENDHKTGSHVSQSLIQLRATSWVIPWSQSILKVYKFELKTGSHWPFLCFVLKVYVNRWLCRCFAVSLGSNFKICGDCSKPQSGWRDMIQIWHDMILLISFKIECDCLSMMQRTIKRHRTCRRVHWCCWSNPFKRVYNVK